MTGNTTKGFKYRVLALVALAALLLGIAAQGYRAMQARGNGWSFQPSQSHPAPPPVRCVQAKDGDIGCPGNSK